MSSLKRKSSKKIKVDEISEQAEVLGRGCHGTIVFKGRYDGKEVAVKRIQMQNAQTEAGREREALFSCQHHRVLQLYKVEEDHNFMRLALELCAGNLSDFCLGRYIGPFPADIEAMKQMLEGLAYLHEKRYVHRDVKPNNILISLHGTLKIADFGFCKPIGSSDNGSFSMSNAATGTEGWMAPELLRNFSAVEERRSRAMSSTSTLTASSTTSLTTITSWSSNNSSSDPSKFKATTAIDVFPLGCVFYYLLTRGSHPFGSGAYRNINILEGKHNLSELGRKHIVKGLIREMIHHSPKHRPQLQEILTRPIFNVTTPTDSPAELIRDANKFEKLLESLRLRFTPKPRSSNKMRSAKLRTRDQTLSGVDETDYSLNKSNNNKIEGSRMMQKNAVLHPAATWTASTFAGFRNGLQTVDELGDTFVPDAYLPTNMMILGRQRAITATMTLPLKKTSSSSQVFSASDAWRRSVSVQKAARRLGFISENFDEFDGKLMNAASRTRSATYLSSQSSLTSTDDSFSGSVISLGRSFMGSDIHF